MNVLGSRALRHDALLEALLDRSGIGAPTWARRPFVVAPDGSWEAQSGEDRITLRFGKDGRLSGWRCESRPLGDMVDTVDVTLREVTEPAAFPEGAFAWPPTGFAPIPAPK